MYLICAAASKEGLLMKRIIMLIATCSWAVSAHAGGFELVNQSAAGAGVANAFAATANDGSALAYNPAGIAWQSGVTVTLGAGVNPRNSSVQLAGGIAPNKGSDQAVAQIFASWAPLDSNFAAGFSFSPMYQLNNNWASGFTTPTGVSKLNVDRTAADLVYAVNSDLAVGFGGDWYITRATMNSPAKSFHGNDLASFGGHASMLWKFQPGWSLGAVARSGTRIQVSGQANDTLSLKLPDQLTLAVAHDLSDRLRLETDVKWTRWSAVHDAHVRTAGVISQSNTLNLRDTVTVMAGVTWTWRENVQFRGGYAYDQGANKSSGFNPLIADQDGHRLSIGAGGDLFGMHTDLAYQYTFYAKKKATGTYAGTYRDRSQSLMFTVTNRFE